MPFATTWPTRSPAASVGATGALLVAFVLAAGLTLTWFGWRATTLAEEQRAHAELALTAAQIQGAVESRLLAYEGMLRAAAGALKAFWPVTPQGWKVFVNQLSLAATYPGVQGVGFSAVLRSAQDIEHWRSRLEPLGLAQRMPAPGASAETAIVMLEPLDVRNLRAIGYDMMGESERRTAMERARDRGEAALTASVRLVQEFGPDIQPGFLMYLPIYSTPEPPPDVESRRAAWRGFAYSPFRAHDFFSTAFPTPPGDAVFEVFDGDAPMEKALLWRSGETPAGNSPHELRTVTVAGRSWTLRVWAGEAADGATPGAARVIAMSGAAITVLMAALVAMLAFSRQQYRERMEIDRMIAEQKRLLAERLEQRVVERTRQLEIANRDLSAANRDLEAFTYTVSHDLRAPLRAIDGHVARLLESVPATDQGQRRHADAVRRNVRRMTHLIEDLLNLALVSRRPLERRELPMWDVVRPVVEELQATHRNVCFDVQPQTLGAVHADPGLLGQALANLLGNAVKFSARASDPLITIGCCPSSPDRVYFVRDNGVGFDMRYAAKLFGVFERLHHAREFEGMGIGLALVKQIIERHGGRVWAQGEPGKGATFFFTVPEPRSD